MLPKDIETPRLLLDLDKMDANVLRMTGHVESLGCRLRPHLKTTKSVALAQHVLKDMAHPITVSTLKEAEYFAGHGARDILYAVGIAPNKLDHIIALRRNGIDLSIILDNIDAALATANKAAESCISIPILIEIDADGHRAGVPPESRELIEVARLLSDAPFCELRGVMAHAGGSYGCRTAQCIEDAAVQERTRTVGSATALRTAGMHCPVVSIGSTPTALFSKDLEGVTEVRAGVFMSFDLVMAGLGVCDLDDIALSVLTTVIGHQPSNGWVIVDAGWMAVSRDRGTAGHETDQGFGLVTSERGEILGDIVMVSANQEHGILMRRGGKPLDVARFPVGTKLRVLPNHACATAAQFDNYLVIRTDGTVVDTWERINGW